MEQRFTDRADAGRRLARALGHLASERPIVLALPRGGVPVGFAVARALGAPLDVLVARKLGCPFQPELGFGAVAEGGARWVDRAMCRYLDISDADVEAIAAREEAEVKRRALVYRNGGPPPDLRGRTAILVDDGVATGGTARAAIVAARAGAPRRLVFAAPVAPPETARALAAEVDELVCLATPARLVAIGLWYDEFRQVSDEAVVALLQRAARGAEASTWETH